MYFNAQQYSGAFLVPAKGRAYWAHGDFQRQEQPETSGIAFYAPDFFLSDPRPWWVFEETSSAPGPLWPQTHDPSGVGPFSEPDFEEFAQDFHLIQKSLQDGLLEKAVPLTQVCASRPSKFLSGDLPQVIARLLKPDASHRTPYGLVTDHEGLVGLTPELLFDWDAKSGVIRTEAIAGTATQENGAGLLHDSKELKEHHLVVEFLASRLSTEGQLDVGETKVAVYGELAHLKTPITCRTAKVLSVENFQSLVRLLHPTPALGIKSQTVDFHWLKQLKTSQSRRRFGAPFGVWDPAVGAKVYVAIRNLEWNQNQIFLSTGCGVVSESELEKEWLELGLKRRAVLASMGWQS